MGKMTDRTDNVAQRLEHIFARLFPGVEARHIRRASIHSVRDWDAIATLSLIVEVEDEFGLAIGFDAAEDIETFGDLYCAVIRTRPLPFPTGFPPGCSGGGPTLPR